MPFDVREMVRSATQLRAEREEIVRIAVLVEIDAPDTLVETLRDRLRPRTAAGRLQIEVIGPESSLVVDQSVDAVIAVVGGVHAELVQMLATLVRGGTHTVAVVQYDQPAEVASLLGLARDNVVGDLSAPVAIDELLGKWLAERIAPKRLALANNFPFLRKHVSEQFVNATSMQNGVIGAVAIFPGADMPLMTANQAKMLLQIAAAYGQDLGTERLKELIAIIGGGFALRAVARQGLTLVPGFGWILKGGIGYGGTLAMGRAAIAYFEQGADLSQVALQLKESAGQAAQSAGGRVKALRAGRPKPPNGDATGV